MYLKVIQQTVWYLLGWTVDHTADPLPGNQKSKWVYKEIIGQAQLSAARQESREHTRGLPKEAFNRKE